MSEPIKVGDLVVVVRQCCDGLELLGLIRTATKVQTNRTRCSTCGQANDGIHVYGHASSNGVPISWVKRIPPLDELEGKKETADLGEAMRKLKRELLEMGK